MTLAGFFRIFAQSTALQDTRATARGLWHDGHAIVQMDTADTIASCASDANG
jgi:hypothetical protein